MSADGTPARATELPCLRLLCGEKRSCNTSHPLRKDKPWPQKRVRVSSHGWRSHPGPVMRRDAENLVRRGRGGRRRRGPPGAEKLAAPRRPWAAYPAETRTWGVHDTCPVGPFLHFHDNQLVHGQLEPVTNHHIVDPQIHDRGG